ncbi:hypothetical protein F5Y19DRAFT_449474 [Xylariaceae sp. FL1651]|nr:hypothetical protein F5Y19DRAFT_449474 [Xylariaceae sp. FL1651]
MRTAAAVSPTWQGCTICRFVGTGNYLKFAMIIQDTLAATTRAADTLQIFTTEFTLISYNEFFKSDLTSSKPISLPI